jgi:biofilm PGA synthesis lipoprotein PgaB
MSWEQIRRCEQSGLVEIASHSHALHRYETSNPYRDTYPSVNTRRYILAEARYENREEYRGRIRKDLEESRTQLKSRLGDDVSVLVWPYGEYNSMARAIATDAGFTTSLALGWREVTAEDLSSRVLPRIMVTRKMNMRGTDLGWLHPPHPPVRAAQVDLDSVYDPNPKVFEHNVDQLVTRARAIGATHVFLQACPDPDGNGFFRQTYFMNHQVPVKADVWSMVANKLNHARLKVWIRAPLMNLAWVWDQHPEWRIPYKASHLRGEKSPWYFRLSPNLPETRRAAIDFFSDIAVYLPIDGVLFDDDLYMLPGESLNGSLAKDAGSKAAAMRALVEDVKATVLGWRPECQFGRNVYAPVVDRNGVDPRFCQDFAQCLSDYDVTAVMAYARMEGHAKDAERWVGNLTRKAFRRWRPPPGSAPTLAPILIKLQAYDWDAKDWVPAKELMGSIAQASRAGATHLGVYPVTPDQGDLPNGLFEAPAATAHEATAK